MIGGAQCCPPTPNAVAWHTLRRMATTALENLVGDMTLSDLSARTGRSVAEIVDYAVRTGQRARSTRSNGVARTSNGKTLRTSKTTKQSKPTSSKAVNTRTAQGRDRYDDAVLQAVRSSRSRIGAARIRRQVGGTPQQVRTALHRLIERGAIDFEGQARATTYAVI